MADNGMRTIEKAMKLASHTFDMTNNVNRYPKKLRYSLVDRMQLISYDIYEYLDDANGMDLRWERWNEEDRLALANILVKAGYNVRIGHRLVPGEVKKKEYVVIYEEPEEKE